MSLDSESHIQEALQAHDLNVSPATDRLTELEAGLYETKEQPSKQATRDVSTSRGNDSVTLDQVPTSPSSCHLGIAGARTFAVKAQSSIPAESAPSFDNSTGGPLSFDEVAANMLVIQKVLEYHMEYSQGDEGDTWICVVPAPEDQPPHWDPPYVANGRNRFDAFLSKDCVGLFLQWLRLHQTYDSRALHYLWWACGVASVVSVKGLDVVSTMTRARDNRLDANAVLQSLDAIGQAEACEIPGTLHYRVSSNDESFFLPYDNADSHSSSVYLAPQIYGVLKNNFAYVCAPEAHREWRPAEKHRFLYLCGVASQSGARIEQPSWTAPVTTKGDNGAHHRGRIRMLFSSMSWKAKRPKAN